MNKEVGLDNYYVTRISIDDTTNGAVETISSSLFISHRF